MKSLVSEFSISYQKSFKPSELPKVDSSVSAAAILRQNWEGDLSHVERFYILLLNRANGVFGMPLISLGGCSGTVADLKVIFQHGLLANAQGLILAHNHPSGQLRPSTQDENITKKAVEFGKLIDLPILDHIILTEEGYYSFADDCKL